MQSRLDSAELSPSTLSFDNWELEEAYRWYALSKFSITTGCALAAFALFEFLALLWNIGSVFGSDPSLAMLFEADLFDLLWIAMHGVFFPIYMFTACALMLRRRCIDVTALMLTRQKILKLTHRKVVYEVTWLMLLL